MFYYTNFGYSVAILRSLQSSADAAPTGARELGKRMNTVQTVAGTGFPSTVEDFHFVKDFSPKCTVRQHARWDEDQWLFHIGYAMA